MTSKEKRPANAGATDSTDDSNTPNPSEIYGIAEIIRADGNLDAIRYNTISHCPYVMGPLPWDGASSGRFWQDSDDANLRGYLEREYGVKNDKKAMAALQIVCSERPHNPIEKMLDALPEWDGVKRADTLFIDFLGAEDSEYVRAVTRLFLNGALMRAIEPGCKFDYMPVLMGRQGIGKSTLLAQLATDADFFTDNIGRKWDEKTQERIQGYWIVEIAELAGFNHNAIEAIKQFVTQQRDNYRAPWCKRTENRPRSCVFVGTTNERAFLTDLTGNRRFLPIQCGERKPKRQVFARGGNAAHMRMVWAEVLQGYMEGALSLTLPRDVEREALRAQDSAMVEDANIGAIRAYLDGHRGEPMCTRLLMERALGIGKHDRRWSDKALQMDITRIIDNKCPGWKRQKGRKNIKPYGQSTWWKYMGK